MVRRVLMTAALAALACEPERGQWTGYVYPDKKNLSAHEALGAFDGVDACRAAALARLRALCEGCSDPLQTGDYECGLKCKPSEQFGGINVCEETRK
jgi:hypothetical protein